MLCNRVIKPSAFLVSLWLPEREGIDGLVKRKALKATPEATDKTFWKQIISLFYKENQNYFTHQTENLRSAHISIY